jgi:hypothetical protein
MLASLSSCKEPYWGAGVEPNAFVSDTARDNVIPVNELHVQNGLSALWIRRIYLRMYPRRSIEKLNQGMRTIKDLHLIIFAVLLSVVIVLVVDLRIAGYLTLKVQIIAAYVIFGLNVMVAIGGLWRRFRLAWFLYLALSISGMLFLSMSTPFTAIWLLIKYAIRRYT